MQTCIDYEIEQENVSSDSKVTLQSSHIGDLNSLYWEEQPETESLGGVVVMVQYAGLNMIDVKRAIDTVACSDFNYINYGMDFSGTTKR